MNTIERLAEVRPEPTAIVDAGERERLLRMIVAEPPTRVRRRVPLLVRAAAVPAMVGALVVALSLGGSPPAEVEPPSTTAAPTVLDRVKLAMAAAESDDLLLHVRSDFGNGVLWSAWHDATGERSRSTSTTMDGAPLYDHEMTASKVRVVSYKARAWWEYDVDEARGEKIRFDGGLTAADIKAQLDDGTLEQVAEETVDGRAVLHLRWIPVEKGNVRIAPGDLWVDAATHLPIRSVAQMDGKPPVRSDFEWLPRTAETEANLTMPLPAGFVHSPTPIEG